MNQKYRLRITGESKQRSVGITEILLTEKLFEVSDFISWSENDCKHKAEMKKHEISKALGVRLSPDGRPRVATLASGEVILSEVH